MTTLNTSVVKVRTPDGTMYVFIIEDVTGKPIRVRAEIGKSGTAIYSWTQAVSNLASALLENGALLEEIASYLITISTSRISFNDDGMVRSGPEGIAYGIMKYLRTKYVEATDKPYLNQHWLSNGR